MIEQEINYFIYQNFKVKKVVIEFLDGTILHNVKLLSQAAVNRSSLQIEVSSLGSVVILWINSREIKNIFYEKEGK